MVYLGLWKGLSKQDSLELQSKQSADISQAGTQPIPDKLIYLNIFCMLFILLFKYILHAFDY